MYIYTQTVHRTTQSTQTIHRTTQLTQTIHRTTQSTQTIQRTTQLSHKQYIEQHSRKNNTENNTINSKTIYRTITIYIILQYLSKQAHYTTRVKYKRMLALKAFVSTNTFC